MNGLTLRECLQKFCTLHCRLTETFLLLGAIGSSTIETLSLFFKLSVTLKKLVVMSIVVSSLTAAVTSNARIFSLLANTPTITTIFLREKQNDFYRSLRRFA